MRGISLQNDLSKHTTPDDLDERSRKVLDDLNLKMTREEIFALKFRGVPVEGNEIFKSLKAFSPTGRAKTLPITPLNMIKFKKFLLTA